MLHMVDWLPTLLEAAGVSQGQLHGLGVRGIDGVSQWPMISRGAESSRQEFVYAINEVSNRAAIR